MQSYRADIPLAIKYLTKMSILSIQIFQAQIQVVCPLRMGNPPTRSISYNSDAGSLQHCSYFLLFTILSYKLQVGPSLN
jgi:hypothetical protein